MIKYAIDIREKKKFTSTEMFCCAIFDDPVPKHHSKLRFTIMYIVTNTLCKDYCQILSLV